MKKLKRFWNKHKPKVGVVLLFTLVPYLIGILSKTIVKLFLLGWETINL